MGVFAASCFLLFGSNCNNGLLVGFAFNLNNALSNANWNIGPSPNLTFNDVKYILENSDEYARKIQKMLINETFSPKVGNPCPIHDGATGKIRVIYKPVFYPDQIIHHCIIRVLRPVFSKSMYEYSNGSVPGRGRTDALKTVKSWMKKDPKGTKYGCDADIRHFYSNINHRILKRKLKRKIKDSKVLNLLFILIDAYPGLPLGLYTSPWFANFLLTDFDHYVKQEIKIKYYLRYMDNLILYLGNKKLLHKALDRIREYLHGIGLWIKRTWQVFRIKSDKYNGREYDVLGYKIRRESNGIVINLRKCVVKRAYKSAKKIGYKRENKIPISCKEASGMLSRMGSLKRATTYGFYLERIKPYVNAKILKRIVSKRTRKESRYDCAF